jgi:hypothetical protein
MTLWVFRLSGNEELLRQKVDREALSSRRMVPSVFTTGLPELAMRQPVS